MEIPIHYDPMIAKLIVHGAIGKSHRPNGTGH